MKSRRVALFTAVILSVALVVTLVLLLALAIPISGRPSSSTQQTTSQTEITTTSPSSNNNTDNATPNNTTPNNTTPNNSTNNNGNNNSNTGNNNGNNNSNTGNNNGNNNNNTTNPNPNQNTTAPCPQIHILAARETTAPPPFGTSKVLVDLLLKAFPGANQATVEAIDYPAAGSTVPEYAASVAAGVAAVVKQTREFNERCPGSLVVMHGYSQGAQIMDDAFCGGPDGVSVNSTGRLVSEGVARRTAAIIMMGNPRHVDGVVFNVGSAVLPGFAARPKGFACPEFQDRIQSYCDAPDPFCSGGNDTDTHQGYGKEYGQRALEFVMGKIRAAM